MLNFNSVFNKNPSGYSYKVFFCYKIKFFQLILYFLVQCLYQDLFPFWFYLLVNSYEDVISRQLDHLLKIYDDYICFWSVEL